MEKHRVLIRIFVLAFASIVSNSAAAQERSSRWLVDGAFQASSRPLPAGALGVEAAWRAIDRGWWSGRIQASAFALTDPGALVVCTASPPGGPCDKRQMKQIGALVGQLTFGPSAQRIYLVVGAGGYASAWAGDAAGSSPSGGLLEGGVGARIPVFGDRVVVEFRGRRYLNMLDDNRASFIGAVGFVW